MKGKLPRPLAAMFFNQLGWLKNMAASGRGSFPYIAIEIIGILIKLYRFQNIIIIKLLNRNAHKCLWKQVFMCFCGKIKCFCHGID